MLKYPNKSHRKIINIPEESTKLAEMMGIILGDGGINNDWQLVITLNAVADREYSIYLIKILEDLFAIQVAVRKRPNKNALVLVSSSTSLVEFLVSKGAVRGNKIAQKINIPAWIKNNTEYERAFVRGLVDTDGCLYIHKHKINNRLYNNLGFCFTSFSPDLTRSVAQILEKNEIQPHLTQNDTRIYLYRKSSVEKYLKTFQTSNLRIFNKYKEWKKLCVADGSVA